MLLQEKNKGIIYIILAALSFATMSLFVQLAGEVPFIQKSFFRNLIALLFSLVVLVKQGGGFSFQKKNLPYLLLRAIFGTMGVFLNFYAIENLMLSDATMINKLSPFFVILFSFVILKERMKIWQGFCILVAFFGSSFIVNQDLMEALLTGGEISTSLGSFPAFIGVLGAMSAGLAYTFIRKLSIGGERGAFIVFFFSAFSTLVCIPFVVFDFHPMTVEQVGCLLGAGIFASLGQFSITAAYSHAPAKEISIYDYSQIIFSAIYGLLFFQQIPNGYSLIGYGIILAVAVYMFRKNKKLSESS